MFFFVALETQCRHFCRQLDFLGPKCYCGRNSSGRNGATFGTLASNLKEPNVSDARVMRGSLVGCFNMNFQTFHSLWIHGLKISAFVAGTHRILVMFLLQFVQSSSGGLDWKYSNCNPMIFPLIAACVLFQFAALHRFSCTTPQIKCTWVDHGLFLLDKQLYIQSVKYWCRNIAYTAPFTTARVQWCWIDW